MSKPLIKISSLHGALRWGDGWMSAYYELERIRHEEIAARDKRIEKLNAELDRVALALARMPPSAYQQYARQVNPQPEAKPQEPVLSECPF